MILETKNEKLGIRTRNKIVSLKEIEQRKRVFAKLIARFDNNLRIEFIQNKKNSNEDKLEMIEFSGFTNERKYKNHTLGNSVVTSIIFIY